MNPDDDVIVQPGEQVQINFVAGSKVPFLRRTLKELGLTHPTGLMVIYGKIMAMTAIPNLENQYPTVFSPKMVFSVSYSPKGHAKTSNEMREVRNTTSRSSNS